jgi:heme-degrading monooxygenase HmoA
MIVHLAIHHNPKPDHVDDLISSMHRFAAAGAGQPGLREVHTLRDAESGKLFGLAIWDSVESFLQGVGAMRAAVQDDAFLEWEDAPPDVYLLEEA